MDTGPSTTSTMIDISLAVRINFNKLISREVLYKKNFICMEKRLKVYLPI